MRNTKKLQFFTILLLAISISGCATRDNSDFQLFHIQSAILAEETATTLESVKAIVEMNQVEAIAQGNEELLENLVLYRESTFVLASDSTTISAGLARAQSEVEETAFALSLYSLLLVEVTEPQTIAFELNDLVTTSLLSEAVATLVEHGAIEYDAKITADAMQVASSAIESLSEAMAEITVATANAVQASYADMAARRQMEIITNRYSTDDVIELSELNRQVKALLGKLDTIHDSWVSLPAIHTELINSLTETSTSLTLRILWERMNEIREETQ